MLRVHLLIAVFLLCSRVHAQMSTLSLNVAEDSWIDVGDDRTYGGDLALSICPRAGYWVYLKFDVSALPAKVLSAALRMKRFDGSRPEEISVYLVEDDSWSEATLHGTNFPAPTEPELGKGADGGDLDVWSLESLAEAVRIEAEGDGVLTLLVREDPSEQFDVRNYFSREGASTPEEAPHLVLDLEEPGGGEEVVDSGWRVSDVGFGIKPAFDVDAGGNFHVTALTEAIDGVVWYARAADLEGPWAAESIAAGYFYGPGDLRVDGTGSAHLAWHNHDEEDANHAVIDVKGNLTRHRVVTPDSHDGWDNSLALDGVGGLHQSSVFPIAFGAKTSLDYSFFDGKTWIHEPVPDSGTFMYGLATSIAIDRAGEPHIAFCRAGDFLEPGDLMLASRDSTGWRVAPVMENGLHRFPSLQTDHWDRPHVAWLDVDAKTPSTAVVRYGVFNNEAWEFEDVDVLDAVMLGFDDARKSVALVLDGRSRPHLAFGDEQVVRYAYKPFGDWQITTVVENREPTYKGLVVLRLDADERPAIAFWQAHAKQDGLVRLAGLQALEAGAQLPGECNGDGMLNVSDPVCLLGHLFFNDNPPLPCDGDATSVGGNRLTFDANADGRVDVSDALAVLGFLFLGGAPHALGVDCAAIEGCPPACGEV